jgi:DNA-binding NarL/FixJ family response regulator
VTATILPFPLRLTPRETQMLALASEGLTDRQIAGVLVLSMLTVKDTLHRARQRLGATNRVEGILLAHHAGVIDLDLSAQRCAERLNERQAA